ncbi:MAG: hypothetical protein PHN56_02585 [Candidatus Nanoarchaeia archaeon]|nr:hypothetical protein [Candidatus Nanoarchaeia archaeon]
MEPKNLKLKLENIIKESSGKNEYCVEELKISDFLILRYKKSDYGNLLRIKYTNASIDYTTKTQNFIYSKFKDITYLDLCCNNLYYLPETVCDLHNLKELIIADNRLEALPENIGHLKNLWHINAEKNKIKELPDSMKNIKSLVELNLLNNELSFISENIMSIESLTRIFI